VFYIIALVTTIGIKPKLTHSANIMKSLQFAYKERCTNRQITALIFG